MRTVIFALVGVIIFVSQPGTIIIIPFSGEIPTQGSDLAGSAALFSHAPVDVRPEESLVLRDVMGDLRRPGLERSSLIGLKRGPVK
jgi:hypothetical protein